MGFRDQTFDVLRVEPVPMTVEPAERKIEIDPVVVVPWWSATSLTSDFWLIRIIPT
jgi:hypothetical protein